MADPKTLSPREVELAILAWRALPEDVKVSQAIAPSFYTSVKGKSQQCLPNLLPTLILSSIAPFSVTTWNLTPVGADPTVLVCCCVPFRSHFLLLFQQSGPPSLRPSAPALHPDISAHDFG